MSRQDCPYHQRQPGVDYPGCTCDEENDPIVAMVRADLLRRSQVGIAKYGVTLARTDLSLRDWLQHAYDETLDQANYLKRAIVSLDTDREVLANQIKGWVEELQPSDLKNRSTADLQDELQRRQTEALIDGTSPS